MIELFHYTALTMGQVAVTSNSGNMTAGYSVGWFSLALINAGLAQGKNRGGLNWFLLSLFLGPLATLLLVAFFPREAEE